MPKPTKAPQRFQDIKRTYFPMDMSPAPEEKGKTLEEMIAEHDEAINNGISIEKAGEPISDLTKFLRQNCLDLVHERDAIHSKHYARIEGEVRKDMNWALKTLKFCTGINQPLNRPQQEEVERLLAKYPDLIPSPTKDNG